MKPASARSGARPERGGSGDTEFTIAFFTGFSSCFHLTLRSTVIGVSHFRIVWGVCRADFPINAPRTRNIPLGARRGTSVFAKKVSHGGTERKKCAFFWTLRLFFIFTDANLSPVLGKYPLRAPIPTEASASAKREWIIVRHDDECADVNECECER